MPLYFRIGCNSCSKIRWNNKQITNNKIFYLYMCETLNSDGFFFLFHRNVNSPKCESHTLMGNKEKYREPSPKSALQKVSTFF